MIDLSGQDVGRYHILEPLGEGGMAKVYKAFDTHLECEVAVKVIRTDQLAPAMLERTLKRFEREAKEVAKLSHPNIVRVMDYGEEDGVPYLVMQYLHGGTLKQFLGKQMPYQEAAALLVPIARALEYAHQHKMVHRDVKPANILVTDSGEPMLTDFGIVKMLDVEDGNTLTGTGVGLGTPQYMAPEQWMGNFAAEVDQYSLGVVFYELVTGHKPYNADTPAAVLLKQAADPLPRPSSYVPGLPDEVEQVLLKSLAKNPKDRYPSMSEMANALTRLERGVGGESQSTPTVIVETKPPKFEEKIKTVAEETSATMVEPIRAKPVPIEKTPPILKTKKKVNPLYLLFGGIGILAIAFVVVAISNGWFNKPSVIAPIPTEALANNNVVPTSNPVSPTAIPTNAPAIAATTGPRTKVCLVTDTGGIDDKSFNATAWKGVENAANQLGVEGRYMQSVDVADFPANITVFVKADCNLIIGVGFAMTDAMNTAAKANPTVKFTGIDFTFSPELPNAIGQQFQADQSAFLAGYLAAGMTKTGKVGTFGGMNITPVVMIMDGYARGVNYHNQVKGTKVQVIGWNINTLNGTMADTFSDLQRGRELTNSLINQGADIILPVAGPVGMGALEAIWPQAGKVWFIGVDSDWTQTQPNYAKYILTSVLKNMDTTTFNIIQSLQDNTFAGGTYVGTLANGGVGLAAPNSVVTSELLKELEQVKADIIAGKIEFNSVYSIK